MHEFNHCTGGQSLLAMANGGAQFGGAIGKPLRRRRERSRGRCQTAINLGSLGDSARLSWREDDLDGNGADGVSDIEGKAAREAASEYGQRASFNGARWEWSQREAVRHRWGDPNG